MSDKNNKKFNDLLGDLLNKGVNTVDKDTYKKAKLSKEDFKKEQSEQTVEDYPVIEAEGEARVSSISPEELAAAMGEVETEEEYEEPYGEQEAEETYFEQDAIEKEEKQEEFSEDDFVDVLQDAGTDVLAEISEEELAEAKAAFDNVKISEYEIESKNAKKEVRDIFEDTSSRVEETNLTPEELKKQKEDEEMLSHLDEETRREYEELARKYSRNQFKKGPKNDDEKSGKYLEEFNFEKRTNIKKVSAPKKKKPLALILIAAALVLAIVLPVYLLLAKKPTPTVVTLESVELNQKTIYMYAYEGAPIDLTNVYLIANYSDGTVKEIECSSENITSKPIFINDKLELEEVGTFTSGKIKFQYENKQASLTVGLCKSTLQGLIVRVYNKPVQNQLFSCDNIDIFKKYKVDIPITETFDVLPSEYHELISQEEYKNVKVFINKGGNQTETNLGKIYENGGFMFTESGEYTIEFVSSVSAEITISVA